VRTVPSKVLASFARSLSFLPSLVVVSLLIGCGGGGGVDSASLLGGGLSTGEVRPLEFGSDNTASMNFSDLSGSEEFTVLFFNASVDEGNFEVELQSLSGPAPSKLLRQAPDPEFETAGEDGDITGAAHVWLREMEAGLADQEGLAPGKNLEQIQQTVSCANGSGIQIKVLNSLSTTQAYTTTCGIQVRSTANAVYYVDQQVIGDISRSVLDKIIDDFEQKIPLERSILGSESDIDGDGLFTVYFTPEVNRLGNSGGGFVTGFFFGIDTVPTGAEPASNEREILYICVPGDFGTVLSEDFWASNIAPTVLPHEFQHMISFNHHVVTRKGNAEIASFNEGLSHFLEDLSNGSQLDRVSVENPSRVSKFLSSTDSAPFTSGISIAQRGGAYLFFRYLYEQAQLGRYPGASDGNDLLRNLLQTDLTGVPNVEAATGLEFKDLLLDFYAALQLSNTGLTGDPRYNFRGIDLHASQEDNRGTVLDGVHTEVVSGAGKGLVSSPGGLFFSLTGNDIIGSGQGINLVAAQGMIPGGAVIRLR